MAKEEVRTKSDTRLRYPSRYNVIVYNDDYTPMAFVIQMLIDIFNKSLDSAQDITMKIHNEDKAIVGTYYHEIAEQKTSEATAFARANGHPLKIRYEKVE